MTTPRQRANNIAATIVFILFVAYLAVSGVVHISRSVELGRQCDTVHGHLDRWLQCSTDDGRVVPEEEWKS